MAFGYRTGSYPTFGFVVPEVVDDDEWVSLEEAGNTLFGRLTGPLRMGHMLAMGYLTGAHDSRARAGVTRSSLQRELAWRERATIRQRAKRVVAGFLNYL